jgi:hypothetical protein
MWQNTCRVLALKIFDHELLVFHGTTFNHLLCKYTSFTCKWSFLFVEKWFDYCDLYSCVPGLCILALTYNISILLHCKTEVHVLHFKLLDSFTKYESRICVAQFIQQLESMKGSDMCCTLHSAAHGNSLISLIFVN